MQEALIQINPHTDERVAALFGEVSTLCQRADAWVILSDSDVKDATEDLVVIKGLKTALEEKRKEYTQPINEHLKSVNDAFKEFTEPLSQADKVTRGKVLTYEAEGERQRQEQMDINRLREEAAQREMQLKGELTESVNLVTVQPEAPAHYRTAFGTLGKAKVKKWEVTDLSLVPLEYLIIDSAKVGKVVRAGLSSIPGIRIWEEEQLRVTR